MDDNPFYVHLDEDIFKVKELEAQARKRDREENLRKKIAEKSIPTSQKLRMKNEIKRMQKDIFESENVQKKEIGLIEAADNALKNRIVQREQMQKFIEKKREMFLMQMTIDQKKEEIKQLEEQVHNREMGLMKAETIIKKDLKDFNKFLERNKKQSRDEIKKAEDETKKKSNKINELKQIRDKKANKFSQNTKHLERLLEYFKYKEFLDTLIPKEDNGKTDEAKVEQKTGMLDIDKYYNMTLPKGLIGLIGGNAGDFEMYFKNTEQIVQIFNDLEQENLFTIKANQDIEIQNEEIQQEMQSTMEGLENQIAILLTEKKRLGAVIEDEQNKIKELDKVRSDNEIEKVFEALEKEIKKVCETLDISKDSMPIDQLKDLEKRIETSLSQLSKFDPKMVFDKSRNIKEEMKRGKNQEKTLSEELIAEEKKQKIMQKTGNRRIGRPIMTRSKLNKEEKVEVKDDIIDEEAQDNLRYFT